MRILLTRPLDHVEPLRSMLTAEGFVVLTQPMFEIKPPLSWEQADNAIVRLTMFDWIVFSSINGVNYFFNRAANAMGHQKLAAVGSATSEAIHTRIGRPADLVPREQNADGLLEILLPEAKQNKRFLIPRGDKGRNILKRGLRAARPDRSDADAVAEIEVYRNIEVTECDPVIAGMMQSGQIDIVVLMSSSAAETAVKIFGTTLRQTTILSISPLTSATVRRYGFEPIYEAEEASLNGIVEFLKNRFKRNAKSVPSLGGR